MTADELAYRTLERMTKNQIILSDIIPRTTRETLLLGAVKATAWDWEDTRVFEEESAKVDYENCIEEAYKILSSVLF